MYKKPKNMGWVKSILRFLGSKKGIEIELIQKNFKSINQIEIDKMLIMDSIKRIAIVNKYFDDQYLF